MPICTVSKYILRPRYELYGRAVPLKRNREMVEIADAILIIWNGCFKGIAYTLEYAKQTNKPFTLVEI
ncbi:MAG: hypothetical protein IKB34_04300 [Clostridia bacterium]|nr:hypothetical protein [Clostridia bacterium]